MSQLPAAPSGEAARTIKVLLVDDQRIIAEAIKRLLEPERDVYLRHCDDPANAFSLMKEFKPDVVLQDLVMPGVDGLNLVQLYKGDPETSKIPVIVLSSEEDAEIKIKAFTVGASDYMVKIPNRVELVCRIREHAKGRIREMRLEAVEAELQRQSSICQTTAWLDALALVASNMIRDLETPLQFISGNMIYAGDAFCSLVRFRSRLSRLPIPPELAAAMKDAADKEDLDFVFEDVPKAFRQSQVELDRAAAIVRALSSFPLRMGSAELVHSDVNLILKDSMSFLKDRLSVSAAWRADLSEAPLKVLASNAELALAFLLLVLGSLSSIDERYGPGGKKGSLLVSSSSEDGLVKVEFSDDGMPVSPALLSLLDLPDCVISAEIQSRRGLPVVKRIVESFGGSLALRSKGEWGCVATVKIPQAAS